MSVEPSSERARRSRHARGSFQRIGMLHAAHVNVISSSFDNTYVDAVLTPT